MKGNETTTMEKEFRNYQELIDTFDSLYIADVCKERQLPDIRDGMRIVQRRIFWTMFSLGKTSRNKLNKSASIIGDSLKLHPHGDSSCYGSLAQEVNSTAGLLKGKGNWGNTTGVTRYGPAAMRYTEVMFSQIADPYFELANMSPMIPGEIELPEPKFIPVPLPFSLVGGFFGMVKKVGVSKIPSYRPKDLLARLKYLLKMGPKVIIKPWYGLNLNPEGEFEKILTTGQGDITVPPTMTIDTKAQIITIDEICPELANASAKIETLAEHPKYSRYLIVKDLTAKSTCIVIEYSTKYMKTVDVTFDQVCEYVKNLFTAKVSYNVLVYRDYKDYPVISVDEWLLYNLELIKTFRLKQIMASIFDLNEKIKLNDAIILVRPVINKYLNEYKSLDVSVFEKLKLECLTILNNDEQLLNKVFSSSITKLLQTEVDNSQYQAEIQCLEKQKEPDALNQWCLGWINSYSK